MNFHMSLNLGWGMWWDKCFISFQFILLVCWGEGRGPFLAIKRHQHLGMSESSDNS